MEMRFEKKEVSPIEFPFLESDVKMKVNPYRDILIWMTPETFIWSAFPLNDGNRDVIEYYKKSIQEKSPIEIPKLFITQSREPLKGLVVGHEGRHRATASKELGIEEMPVIISFISENLYKHEEYPDNLNMRARKVMRMNAIKSEEFRQQLVRLEKQIDRPPLYCEPKKDGITCDLFPEKMKGTLAKPM
jgi:hypothetical protein